MSVDNFISGKNDTADKEVRILTGKRNWAELGSIVSYDNRTRLDSWWEESTEDTEVVLQKVPSEGS